MKFTKIEYQCHKCRKIFIAPGMMPYSYGEFILYSRQSKKIRCFNALEDSIYKEVSEKISKNKNIKKSNPPEILEKIFGKVACDPDEYGESLQMTTPFCPFCKSDQTSLHRIPEPLEFIEIEPLKISHTAWLSLAKNEKIKNINEEIIQLNRKNNNIDN